MFSRRTSTLTSPTIVIVKVIVVVLLVLEAGRSSTHCPRSQTPEVEELNAHGESWGRAETLGQIGLKSWQNDLVHSF